MNKKLFLMLFICMGMFQIHAQTITWTGAADNLYSNPNNWNPAQVPTAVNDVIVPTGSTMTLNVAASVKSINVQGTSTVTINNNLQFTNASSFSSNTIVYWNNSSLYGGGTLTNNGTVNLTTGASRYISGATTVINNGTFTMPAGGYLYLYDTSVFNNTVSGIFDFQSDAIFSYNGSDSHNFINAGLIKKTSSENAALSCYLSNTGTISVEQGSLTLDSKVKTFIGGTYNVASESQLILNGPINVSDTLTGVLDGPMVWKNNISVAITAMFNFSGDTGVNWTSNSLLGGGTLTNAGTINLTTGGSRYISGVTTLINTGLVTMPEGGYLYLYDTSVFNNTASGIFDFHSDAVVSYSGSDSHNFINAGLLKKTTSSGNATLSCYLSNTGTISVEQGSLTLDYREKTFIGGTYNVASESQLILNGPINVSDALTGELDGPIVWKNNISVATTATFNFSGDAGVNWTSNYLFGGGTLTNASTINLSTGGSRYISGGTTLKNTGLVTMPAGGYLYLYDTSVFNNTASGIFDFQSDAVVSYSGSNAHNFINAGLLKKTTSSGNAALSCYLSNTGTISVEQGSLTLDYKEKTFIGGIYNVASESQLILNSLIKVSDTLTGELEGPLVWNNNISVATTATFNFSGDAGVNWTANSLLGGGTLTNASTINLTTGGSRYISGTITTLINTGTINFPSGGYLYLYDDTSIVNQSSGIIDIQSDAYISYSGSGLFKITNAGLIKKSAGTGVTYIYPPVTNSGIIDSQSGTLNFNKNLNNTEDGIIKGTATIALPAPANFTNDGTFAPGGSPGTLTVLGTYKSTSSSVLDVEINGLTAGTDYDQLVITGSNAIFEGTVDIDLSFEASVGDSFTIATVSGTIATKNLVSPVFTVYGCREYTLAVSYPGDNSVVLTVTNKGEVQPPQVETQNITVQLDINGNVSITPEQIDNGSGAGCTEGGELTFSLDRTDFSCADLGENTVTLTVMDELGNSAFGTAIVTVEDDMAPSIMTQNITVNLDASGSVTISPSDIDSGSTDNCSITSRSLDISTFNCLNIGSNSVILTVTDQSGNSTTATATVTVTDTTGACNEAPIAVCQTVSINSDANCQANVTAEAFDGGSSDPNGLPLTFSVDPVGPYNVGITTVILTVSNGTDSSSCTTTITVVDNELPMANCTAPFTVDLDANGQATISVADVDNGSSDNCGIASITLDKMDFGCADVGENTVTLTVTDVNGNISTCSTTVTITDTLGSCNEAPMAFCQAITKNAGSNCSAEASAAEFDGGSTDPNGLPLTLSVDPVGPYNVGITNVTLTVSNGTDSSSCTTTITVIDNELPVANCAAPFTVDLDANGQATISVADVDNGSSDNCGIASITLDRMNFGCADVGENTVNLTVTDVNGNVATCSTTVTVEDNMAPTVLVQDINVQLDASGNAAISVSDIDNGSFDNCSIASMELSLTSFDCAHIGANNVTLTATDASGNVGSAVAVITVEDPLETCTLDGCGEENPAGPGYENAYNCSPQSPFKVANDVTVPVNEKFTLTNITARLLTIEPITNVDVIYYEDATGLPGTPIGSQTSVTIEDQNIVGNYSFYNIVELELSVDPFTFIGQPGNTTTYWIELAVRNSDNTDVFWEITTTNINGYPLAFFNTEWFYIDSSADGIYKWEGICEPLDGTACLSPSDLTVDSITAYSADVSWTSNGTESNWIFQYGPSGFDPETEGISISVSGSPNTTINSLTPNTSYDVYVKADCGTQQSDFIGPVNFVTEPDSSSRPFVTTWRTTTSNESITIPTYPGESYNYSVDWGDGSSSGGYTGNATHVYSAPGTYTVSISGQFPHIYFNNSGDRMKIRSIEQWGSQQWTSMRAAFAGAGNLISNAVDMPDLTNVTDMYGMFAYARKFNGDVSFGNWDVSNVTNMYGMFGGASAFNHPIGDWDVSNVTNMANMFNGATMFNQDLSNWNVGSVNDMHKMFRTAMRFNSDIGSWNVQNVTDMREMFAHANRFDQNLENWNVSNVETMVRMFFGIALSTDNYDALLNGWSSLSLQSNVRFHGGNSKYCAGEWARQYIINTYNWTISDGGLDCESARLDLSDPKYDAELVLYPNPVKNIFTISNPQKVQLDKLEIFDLTGRLVKTVNLEQISNSYPIDVSHLSSATYMIVISANSGRVVKQLIKE